ncbi:hypothetical protein EV702DRAFT_1112458 [Suillus placidus]|uniref:ATPase AAA-type core domain-containing protein n=1 Tax=Suillus placidus TaxID=48579 RepID=A0A9P7D1V1_9AGAM|nr:hypothetical protein EV702DRAFT_1112458 [Suillus placidus]
MITGPPGIGKTTSAHLCAKLEGFTPIELNASDARSKKLVEAGTTLVVDAFACGVFDGATRFIPVWSRRRIRRPKPNDVPSVHSLTDHNTHHSYDIRTGGWDKIRNRTSSIDNWQMYRSECDSKSPGTNTTSDSRTSLHYSPTSSSHLIDQGADAVDDVIERMDEYYLSRED